METGRREFVLGLVTILSGLLGCKPKYYSDAIMSDSNANSENCWSKPPNETGVLVTKRLLLKYGLFFEDGIVSRVMDRQFRKEYDNFVRCAMQKNYTPGAFFAVYDTLCSLDELIRPKEVGLCFDIENDKLFDRVGKLNDDELAENALKHALIVTHSRMELGPTNGQGFSDFIEHIRIRKGDCTDFTYAAANNYFRICELLGRDDLKSRIRMVFGVWINGNSVSAAHSSLDFVRKGELIDIEAITIPEKDVCLDDLNIVSSEGESYLKLMSSRFDGKFKHYAHVFPRN